MEKTKQNTQTSAFGGFCTVISFTQVSGTVRGA